MRDLVILLVHLITTIVRFLRPGGLRAVVAESVLANHQLLILNRSRRRAPNLCALDRLSVGICSFWIKPNRLPGGDRLQALHVIELSSCIGEAKIPAPIFTKAENEARSERPDGRFDPGCCRNETAQSDLGMSSYCRSDQFGLRNLY